MHPDKVRGIIREGRLHLRFMAQIYMLQVEAGRMFLHEHPAGARSWGGPIMAPLINHPDVPISDSDQCQYGQTTTDDNGQQYAAKKPTRWMSNSHFMLARLRKKCPGKHPHSLLLASRAKHAAFYPLELITEILRGIRDHADERINRDDPEDILANTITMLHNKLAVDEKKDTHHNTEHEDSIPPTRPCTLTPGRHV